MCFYHQHLCVTIFFLPVYMFICVLPFYLSKLYCNVFVCFTVSFCLSSEPLSFLSINQFSFVYLLKYFLYLLSNLCKSLSSLRMQRPTLSSSLGHSRCKILAPKPCFFVTESLNLGKIHHISNDGDESKSRCGKNFLRIKTWLTSDPYNYGFGHSGTGALKVL